MDAVANFRQNLAAVLQAKNISQYDLETSSGVSRVHINRILNGKAPNLSIPVAAVLAEAVGFDIAEMLLPYKEFRKVFDGQPGKKKLATSA